MRRRQWRFHCGGAGRDCERRRRRGCRFVKGGGGVSCIAFVVVRVHVSRRRSSLCFAQRPCSGCFVQHVCLLFWSSQITARTHSSPPRSGCGCECDGDRSLEVVASSPRRESPLNALPAFVTGDVQPPKRRIRLQRGVEPGAESKWCTSPSPRDPATSEASDKKQDDSSRVWG